MSLNCDLIHILFKEQKHPWVLFRPAHDVGPIPGLLLHLGDDVPVQVANLRNYGSWDM
jgi:hypothetical protein